MFFANCFFAVDNYLKHPTLKHDIQHTDLETLIELYRKEATELKDALLNGALWTEVKDKSDLVTQLARAINKRQAAGHPSENRLRIDPMEESV